MADLLESYYEDINILDKTSYLYDKNIANDTDYNLLKDYYLISLKNQNFKKDDSVFLGDQEGNGNKETWKQHRNMKLLLRTQGDRNNELKYKENGVTSEIEPQMTNFDYAKYVEMSKKKSDDITKRLYPDGVRQVLYEAQSDPYKDVIKPIIRKTIETKKPQLYQYMREFKTEHVNNNVVRNAYKRPNLNVKNDIEFFTNRTNNVLCTSVPNKLGEKNILKLIDRDEINKTNNISIVVKNVNNQPKTYVRMLWSDTDGKTQLLEFELSNTLGQLPKPELMKIVNEVLNDLIVNELNNDFVKKNHLGQKPNNNNLLKVGEEVYLSNESNKQLKHNINIPNTKISIFLKKVINDIVKDDKNNFNRDSRSQNNIKEALLWKIQDYCKHNKIDPAIIELLTKDSVLNKIQKINYEINYKKITNDKYHSNNNVQLNNRCFLNLNKQNKLTNDIDFSLNKNNILNNDNAQLINWNPDDFGKISYNTNTVPSDYSNNSRFLHNAIKETRSFNS
jgi:hypothetical protein